MSLFQHLEQRLRSYRFAPGLLPWLPLDSRSFGPPRRRAGTLEYFASQAGTCEEVYPAQPALVPHPEPLNDLDPDYFLNLRPTLPAAYVFSLPHARLLGSAGWIVGERDTLLVEASFWREPDFPHPFPTHYVLGRKRALPIRHLPGRTLSLASDFSIGGFGHFLHDSLARLHLAEKAGHRLRDFDWLYLPRIDTSTTRRLAASLDFPPEKILQFDPHHDLATDELVATTYPGSPGNVPAYTPAFLRQRFITTAAPPTRRIYLSRRGFRRDLANREEIEALLIARGFEVCLPHEVDCVQRCAEAAVVVAAEGANLVNTVFSPPGTGVIMLLPARCRCLPYHFSIAEGAGHRALTVSCPPAPGPAGQPDPEWVFVAPDLLATALDRALAGR